jgi:hypothetical protein
VVNSSTKKSGKTLARFTPVKVESFLVELTNLNDAPESAERFSKRFSDFQLFEVPFRAFSPTPGEEKQEERSWLLQLRAIMQAIWTQPDARRREWNGAVLRTYLAMPPLDQMKTRLRAGDPMAMILPEPLPESPIERAMDYLLKSHHKARHCENPQCPAPYFFGIKSKQRFCGEACAEHGQREAKRRWWNEHGDEWRSKQKKQGIRNKATNKRT